MSDHELQAAEDLIHSHALLLLREVIQQSNRRAEQDLVSRALLYLLTRAANTWQSITTLRNHSVDANVFVVDAGTLLRAMFDAYLQAEYVHNDPAKAAERATDYLDFEHVERYKQARRIGTHDNPFTRRLQQSPRRDEGDRRIQREYDRVKGRYSAERRRPRKPTQKESGTRNQWYAGTLADIAQSLGKKAEYDLILATFHGCVHSSAFAVRLGPPVSAEHFSHWALTIVARIARLSVEYNALQLGEFYSTILEKLCKPYFN